MSRNDIRDESHYLSFLLFVAGGFGAICCAVFPPWIQIAIAAYITGTLALLSIWLALGCGSLVSRLSRALLPGSIAGLAVFAFDDMPLAARLLGFTSIALILPAISMPCVVLRSLGFRLVPFRFVQNVVRDSDADRPIQFTLLQLFFFTSCVAGIALWARLLTERWQAAPLCLSGALLVASSSLGAVLAVFAARLAILRFVMVAALSGFTSCLIVLLIGRETPVVPWTGWATLTPLMTGVALLQYRRLGYRLVRRAPQTVMNPHIEGIPELMISPSHSAN